MNDDQKKVTVRFIMRLQEIVDGPPFLVRDKVKAFIKELTELV